MRRLSATLAAAAFAIGMVAVSALAQAPAGWPQPNPDTMQAGAFKDMVLYGKKLFNETYSVIGPEVADRNMRYSGNNLSCQSCHLDSGRHRLRGSRRIFHASPSARRIRRRRNAGLGGPDRGLSPAGLIRDRGRRCARRAAMARPLTAAFDLNSRLRLLHSGHWE